MKTDTQQLVRIPVGTVCLPLSEITRLRDELVNFRRSNAQLHQQVEELEAENHMLEVNVKEFEQKNAELEKDVKDKGDSVMYWFNKYQSLCNELEREKEATDAATEAT